MNEAEIRAAIAGTSGAHILRNSPESYVHGFVTALLNVYPPSRVAEVLLNKFFIPNRADYSDNAYYEYAAELSVANHLKLYPVEAFETDKQVNPNNDKDVDCFYRVGPTQVAIEIKSAREVDIPSGEGHFVLRFAGRVPNHEEEARQFREMIESSGQGATVSVGQNKDMTHLRNLEQAHAKFDPNSGADHLNILFLPKGNYPNMSEWYMHLFGNEGLFTENPFHPPDSYGNVDMVILSNLRYFHEHARQHHDWRLRDVLMIPILNPRRRALVMSESIINGLSPFAHHLREFNTFTPHLDNPDTLPIMNQSLKVSDYVVHGLTTAQRRRYFPVVLPGLSDPSGHSDQASEP